MKKEIWKPYIRDERYEVSTFGNVRRLDSKKIRTPSVSKNGYLICVFSVPRSKPVGHYIHRMVVETFIQKLKTKDWVSHIDGSRNNNRLENLLVESRSKNMKRKVEHGTNNDGTENGGAKLSKKSVYEIRSLADSGILLSKIAKKYNISVIQVSRIKRRVNWKRLPEINLALDMKQ